ncbi:MAG: hypothetical protein ACFFBD_09085 [Candidatus Hodarchaeota archaeon]
MLLNEHSHTTIYAENPFQTVLSKNIEVLNRLGRIKNIFFRIGVFTIGSGVVKDEKTLGFENAIYKSFHILQGMNRSNSKALYRFSNIFIEIDRGMALTTLLYSKERKKLNPHYYENINGFNGIVVRFDSTLTDKIESILKSNIPYLIEATKKNNPVICLIIPPGFSKTIASFNFGLTTLLLEDENKNFEIGSIRMIEKVIEKFT